MIQNKIKGSEIKTQSHKSYSYNSRDVILLVASFIFLFFITPFSSGATDTSSVDDVFKVNELIRYTKPCIFNGTYCSDSAVCNYTFYDKDNSILINNEQATSVGNNGASLHEKNITFSDTGLYKVDMICCDNSVCGSETLYFEVTGDGFNNTLGFYILIIAVATLLISFGLYKYDPTPAVLGGFCLILIGLYILFNGIDGMKDAVFTYGFGIIVLGTGAYVSIKSAFEFITN